MNCKRYLETKELIKKLRTYDELKNWKEMVVAHFKFQFRHFLEILRKTTVTSITQQMPHT